jgi:hypothetical protein
VIKIVERWLDGLTYRKYSNEAVRDIKVMRHQRGRSSIAASSSPNSDPRKRGESSLCSSSTDEGGRGLQQSVREDGRWAATYETLVVSDITTLAAEMKMFSC